MKKPTNYTMSLTDIRDWLRSQKLRLNNLIVQGDKHAIAVEAAYRAWYDLKDDPKLIANLQAAVKDYMIRDHLVSEESDLARRFGHRYTQ